jgi:toxin ParE1/3/4
MKLEFAPRVESDLEEIADWIAQDSPTRAISFLRELAETAMRIGSDPFLYRLRPEIGDGARMAVVGKYVLVFRVLDKVNGQFARIERIVSGARDLAMLLN